MSSFRCHIIFLCIITSLIKIQAQTKLGFAQNKSNQNKVKLVGWKSIDCDGTYDPYRLIDRITDFEVRDGITFITVNFKNNCCPEFNPSISLKGDKLLLLPYDESYDGGNCECDCCFSIQFNIEGLPEKGYGIYFKGKKIERSSDHYKVFETSQEQYQGATINRLNKYGFKEGTWITFYDSQNVKEIIKYPDQELYHESRPIWRKRFYPSGRLSGFSRNDTTESWFEDGQLRSKIIDHKMGDTTYRLVFFKYDNRQVANRTFEKSYPVVFRSKFDPDYEATGSIVETVYEELFFESGKRKYLYGKDTSYSWYEWGMVKSKKFKDGEIKFDDVGNVTEKEFHWKGPGKKDWGDFSHSLYVYYNSNGKIASIKYNRYEGNEKKVWESHYYWVWDAQMKLITSPAEWHEALPWKEFPAIKIP